MDIHQLELFLAVMDSPSMTRAAEKIHLSPGAVSLQLHNLADELHTELFVRRGKRLIPTPAALRLAERAKEVVKMMGHIQQEFENDLAKDVRPFHFATGVTTLIYQLGGPLRQLRKRYPKAEIRVTVGVTEEMVAGLLDPPRACSKGTFALLSEVSCRRSSPEEELGTRDGAYRVSSKVDRIHRQFSPHHLGPGLIPSRYSWPQTARVNSRLINDCFSKTQHRNFLSWLTIGLLGGSWPRHVGIRQSQLQVQELSLQL